MATTLSMAVALALEQCQRESKFITACPTPDELSPRMDLIDPLFDAVVKGDESVVNHLVGLGIGLTVNDEDGLTALHWAASSTEGEKLVPFLIANGAIIDAKDNIGRTPLHVHCARGRIYAVACLVYHGADPNCKTCDTGQTAHQIAAAHGHEEILRILTAYGAEAGGSRA